MKSLQDYRELVTATERLAAEHPRRYRLRLAGLALLGFGYVAGLALVALALGIGLIVALVAGKALALLKLAWIPLAFAYFLLKALWVRLPPPTGRPIRADEAPALFKEIAAVRAAMRSAPISEVLLTAEMNAAVAQVPRLAFFGWYRNYLVLGLPLLASLSPGEFRAVLAHEFGHLAGGHARFGNWIYRIRQTWSRLLAALHERTSWGGGILKRFFDWYAPYFNAYSFVLARGNEYEADRESARLVGAELAASALTAVYLKSHYAGTRYWDGFYAAARDEAEVPAMPFSQFVRTLRNPAQDDLRASLPAVLAGATDVNDTHPSLTDRLAALKATAALPPPPEISALDALLGPARDRLLADLDTDWREHIVDAWRERHGRFQAARRTVSEFESSADGGGDAQRLWQYAQARRELDGDQVLGPLLEGVLQADPSHAPALFTRGRLALARDDAAGLADLEQAMDLEVEAVESACRLVYGFLERRGELERYEPFRRRYENLLAIREAASAEREVCTKDDALVPHELDAQAVDGWVKVLRRDHGIRRAWLVRKAVSTFQHQPCYVLLVEFGLFSSVTTERLRNVVNAVPTQNSCVLLVRSQNRWAKKKFDAVPGSLILS